MQAKFVPGGFFFCCSGCTWKSTGGVHATQCVCEMTHTIERYLPFKKLGFLEQQTTVSSFFLKYSFRRAMLQLEFRESNKSKPEESHFEQSQRHRRYVACTVGGDDVWTLTTHETRLSRDVELWPIFLLKYSLRRAMLRLEFR